MDASDRKSHAHLEVHPFVKSVACCVPKAKPTEQGTLGPSDPICSDTIRALLAGDMAVQIQLVPASYPVCPSNIQGNLFVACVQMKRRATLTFFPKSQAVVENLGMIAGLSILWSADKPHIRQCDKPHIRQCCVCRMYRTSSLRQSILVASEGANSNILLQRGLPKALRKILKSPLIRSLRRQVSATTC